MTDSGRRAEAGTLAPTVDPPPTLHPDLAAAARRGCPVAHAAPDPAAPGWPPPGFRHLFPALPAPPAGPAHRGTEDAALRPRLAALAVAMQAEDPFDATGDNPGIPAGYTYLMQFVAHDIVNTELPIRALGAEGRETRDLAVTRLRLATLYGGGPMACPFAYATGSRSRLRIAPIGLRRGEAGTAPLRDIPRTRLDPPHGGPLDEAMAVDPRNDDNSNISQVTVLFSAFHNAVEAMVARAGLARALRYAVAREAVTLAYRRLLREDLLPRLLHPRVWNHYREPGAALLDRPRDRAEAMAMPLEFCLGAFRCGHAMVRERYRTNDTAEHDLSGILRATSGGASGAMPLSREWVIRWSHFFRIPGRGRPAPNPSRRLRPKHSPGLLDSVLFPEVDRMVGLAYRDLLGAGMAGLHGVAALWDHLMVQWPDLAHGLVQAGPGGPQVPLHEPEGRREALLAWMQREGVPEPHASALAEDPPLPFYVLFEAAAERDGLSLGRLGSVIVAETILGILRRDPLPCEAGGGDVPAALRRLAAEVGLPARTFDAVARIRDMPGLVLLAATAPEIGAADPAFV